MTKILAPSNVGYVSRSYYYDAFWHVVPNPPSIRVAANPTVLASFKSATVKADHKRPTDYCRMIAKVTPGGAVNCSNGTYVFKSETSAEASIAAIPNGCSIPNGDVAVPQWMVDKVVLDALSEMNQISANIYEDLGQLKQTGDMIADIFQTIVKGFSLARKGNWKAFRRLVGEYGVNIPRLAATGWLTYFYGIKPLIGTIDALAMGQKPKYQALSVRKRVSTSANGLSYVSTAPTVRFSGKAEVQAQCELSAAIKLQGNLSTWQNLGITSSSLNDALVSAWALAPYSFVVDWLIPIEAWLRTLAWAPFLEYQGGYVGRRHSVNGSLNTDEPFYGTGWIGVKPKCQLDVKFYKRTSYPYFVPPVALSIRLSLNPNQIISAAALITVKG